MLTAEEVIQRYLDGNLPGLVGLDNITVFAVDAFGDTLLHIACIRNNIEEVEALLQGGADVNAIGDKGYRPIHYAADRENREIAKLLLSHGADPDVTNDFGNKPNLDWLR